MASFIVLLALLPAACTAMRATSEVGENASATVGYATCPGKGCIACTATWLGYSLKSVDETHYIMQVKDGTKIPVVLPIQTFGGEGGSKNCFAYATHQLYQIPAGSAALVAQYGLSPVTRPADVSEETFEEAMRREEAIFLGRETKDLQNLKELAIVKDRSYYLVAVFLTPGDEYHFWGLWNNGWYCVSSKISAVAQDMGYFSKPSKQCPTGSMWTQMQKKNAKYSNKMAASTSSPAVARSAEGFQYRGDTDCGLQRTHMQG
eukprot:CAMPEP_0180429000 /NCGR_PEP_ID=MMETSP1036_2-20121128/7129_1 /TAXON_ID=632150 /ORGANISM="Azadinium spinosum, Strain 3D9" /LENGTH=261 /DNA_ID=CAMNT_0022434659 /DNA_START=75 /DNA_END=858 /DNA_ORIENTATION=+